MRKIFIWLLIAGGIIYIARAGIEILQPQYWNPQSLLDYSAVILTTFQETIFGLVLISMLKLKQPLKNNVEKLWGVVITVTGFAAIVSGVGNLLEDALGFSKLGNFMFSYGGLVGGIALMSTFFSHYLFVKCAVDGLGFICYHWLALFCSRILVVSLRVYLC